ncbi:MAG TPA: hypothetical protein VN706_21740 [Gemmatimonadaceae bacterium]|nr:hypothetical protein [Gemmatimonadaceae bacterium]
MPSMSFRRKLREWLLRYGPAELAGLTVAFIASVIVRRSMHSAIAAGYAAAWGETIGYVLMMVVRDYTAEVHASPQVERRQHVRHASNVATGLLAEFGPAGVIDTFVTRPLAMTLGIRFAGPVFGLVIGKLAADAVFYAPVIYMYERRKHRRARAKRTDAD